MSVQLARAAHLHSRRCPILGKILYRCNEFKGFSGFWFVFTRAWRQHLYCSWAHPRERCGPHVWEKGCKYWHCDKCHPCGEDLVAAGLITKEKLYKDAAEARALWKRVNSWKGVAEERGEVAL